MEKIKSGQYSLRANISESSIAKVRRIQGLFAASGKKYTIEQVIEYIIQKSPLK